MPESMPISEAVRELPLWKSIEGRTAIQRKFRFKDFPRAWSFLTEVALIATVRRVSPEINNFAEKVTLTISGEDLSLAGESVEFAKAIDLLLPVPAPKPKTKAAKKVPPRPGR